MFYITSLPSLPTFSLPSWSPLLLSPATPPLLYHSSSPATPPLPSSSSSSPPSPIPLCRNIAEALISKGYGSCLRHRQNDDMRSSSYDDLLAAEARAFKNLKGVHSKKDVPVHRVADISQVRSKGGREGGLTATTFPGTSG